MTTTRYKDFKYQIDGNEAVIVKYIGNDRNIIIPSKINNNPVVSIADDAFVNCSSLTSVTIPDSVTSIENYAFYGCSNLTSVTIPDSVTSIGEGAFEWCSSLTSVTIPGSVTSIDAWAFYNCSSLASATIGNSVTSIGNGVFRDCRSLTSITIPNSVTQIGQNAFANCFNLKTIKCNPGSYAERWARDNDFKVETIMSKLQQLLNQTDSSIAKICHSDSVNERGDYNEI